MRQLEKDLGRDLVDTDQAVRERLRKQVREFLLHEASLLSDTRVKNADQITDLIQLYARVNLLKELIERPKSFNLKDQKDLLKSVDVIKGVIEPAKNPMNLISELDISGPQKAQLVEAVIEATRLKLREQLNEGKT